MDLKSDETHLSADGRKREGRPHRAWGILAACCLMEAGTLGILWNCTGLFYAPICEEMGFRTGDFSLFVTLRSLAGAFTVGILTAMIHKVRLRPFLLGIVAVCCGAFMVTCFYTELYQWYISGVVMGVAGSSFFMVTTALFINNWFYKKNGFAMGLAMAASGLGGALFNPVISLLILHFGWRQAVVMTGLIAFGLAAPATGMLIFTPEEAGYAPYGLEKGTRLKTDVLQNGGGVVLLRRLPYPRTTFALCLCLLGSTYFLSQFNGHLPTYAQHAGYGIQTAGAITSVAMLGNVSSKLLMGWAADRKGVWFAVGAGLLVSAASFLLLLTGFLPAVYAGAFFYGTALTMSTIPPVLVTRHVYGLEAYERKYTRIITINQVIAALAFSVIGYARDFFGSYVQSFWLGFGLCILSAISMTLLIFILRGTKIESL